MGDQIKKKWTVFFLVKSANGSILELIRMVNEIRSVEQNPENSIVLCLNVVKENIDAVEQGDPDRVIRNGKEIFTTVFYKLVPDKFQASGFPNRLQVISRYPKFDITKPNHLKVFFRDKVLQHFEADRYLLFTWDHGSAFGVFSKDPKEHADVTKKFLDIKEEKGVGVLTMEALSNAITWGFGKKKIDLLIMMNCYMQFFDAGYALQKTVKYLVAPETAMSFDGYNYPFIFQALADDPKISPKKLAKYAVSSFIFKVYLENTEGVGQKFSTAIFASKLKYYDTITKLINKLSSKLIPIITDDDVKQKIIDIRDASYVEDGKGLMDLFAFVNQLVDKKLLKNEFLLVSLLLSVKELIIVKSFVGDYFLKRDKNKIPNGFTIFFPGLFPIPGGANENFIKTRFYQENMWKDFLKKCLT